MKLGDFYNHVIKNGLTSDPRTRKEIEDEMKKRRKEYNALKTVDKKYFDKEKLKQPYDDTRILYGDKDRNVSTIMVGIDMGGEELLTANFLNEKGAGINLALSHHPSGKALAGLFNVMHVQTDLLVKQGLNLEIAKSLMKERITEVSRRLLPSNHERSVDIARLINMPLMSAHTPADNHVASFLQNMFNRKKPKKAGDVVQMLKTIPEYQDGMRKGAGPKLIAGKETSKAGKVFVDMTGGTEGSKRIFARLSQAGVGTLVAMHLSDEHYNAAKSEFINLIIAGHIASDNLGLNLLFDKLSKKQNFNIIPCSGFVRVKR